MFAWVEKHKWAYPFLLPILVPLAIAKLFKALSEWGKDGGA